MDNNEKTARINQFVDASKKLIGREVRERPQWNTHVTGDAIRHFALGIGDDNPLYLDPDYACKSPFGRQLAPPAFLTSVLYPMLHGASMNVPLWFLVGEVKYQWFLPILVDDKLQAASKPIDLFDTKETEDKRRIFLISETCYFNQDDQLVGKCTGTTVCVPKNEDRLLIERSIYKYSDKEIEKIAALLREETRNGNRRLDDHELKEGQKISTFVRGPLTIGDLICWQSAVGPAYQAGAPGFRSLARSHIVPAKNPVTGWSIESSQQHEDFLLTSQRGMPIPFDQGVMRFACLSPMITNWMGDNGFLNWLSVKIVAPNLYGDTTWYHGVISERSDLHDSISLKLKITGTNQLGETTTEAEAGVTLPRKQTLSFHRYGSTEDRTHKEETTIRKTWAMDLFKDQALRQPDAVALIFQETKQTYGETDDQSGQVAANLSLMGVKANEPVAICMNRSHKFILAVLGVLKAGAAFVPMDPDYPTKRLAEMLSDCQTRILIVDSPEKKEFPDYPGKIVFFDSLLEKINSKDDEHPARQTKKEDLAYIMYTSGSLGKAKGVAVTHGNLSSYLLGLKQTFDVHSRDICLHTGSFSFSASIRQIFLPICSGAALVVADAEDRRNPLALAELIQKSGVTNWDTVPSFLSLCCDAFMKLDPIKAGELLRNRLRRILVTGEPLPWEIAYSWNQRLKHDADIINLYSQTETSGTVCSFQIPKDSTLATGFVPIGVPTPDTVIYILNENLQPVSYGEVGEICVAGPRIAKGYLNRPEQTALQFISHPFAAEAEFRIFKTGDLGCYLPDGNIVTKGRRDRRVKIRGFRIELEEVERVLSAHPEITQAVVVASEVGDHEKKLLAYIVPRSNPAPKSTELRTFLQGMLPDYMLPAHYILLEKIPLSPNGKVAYHELPAPEGYIQSAISPSDTKPIDALEEELILIWKKILGLSAVGRKDNFFDMGGDSLQAVRLMLEIEQILDQRLALALLYENPTITGLAAALRNEGESSKWQALVPVQPHGSKPPFFCVYAMARTLAPHLDPEQPFYWFNWFKHGKGDGLVSNYTVPDIAESHIKEMRSVQPNGPYFLGGFSFGGTVALEMALQLHSQGEQVAFLALFDPSNPHRKIHRPKMMERIAAAMESKPTWGAKSRYVIKRISDAITYRIMTNLQILASKYYILKKKPLPHDLNVAILFKMSERATMNYEYRTYPGHITLFVPEYRYSPKELEDPAILGWRNLAQKGVSLHIVKGAHKHIDIVNEPYVSDLVKKLNVCLRETQKKTEPS